MNQEMIKKARKAWGNMKERCTNKNHPRYHQYGGIGITFSDSWKTFDNFLSDLGAPFPGFSLGRLDANKGYTPNNCTWMSLEDLSANVHSNLKVTWRGKEWSLTELADKTNIPRHLLHRRIYRGKWSVDKAIKTPALNRPKCIKWGNKYYTIGQLAKSLGISRACLNYRIKTNWPKSKWTTPT